MPAACRKRPGTKPSWNMPKPKLQPVSRASRPTISSNRPSSTSAALRKTRCRSTGGAADHAASAPAAATVATTSPVYGSRSSNVAPSAASTQSPPMNCRYSCVASTSAPSLVGVGGNDTTRAGAVSTCQDGVPASRTCAVARPEPAGSQSLERGLAILSTFRSAQPLLGVSDLSRQVGLSRSTTHRYVATLAALGYLQQDVETKKYRLGPRVLDLGFSAINSMELRHIASPHLEQLSHATGHTVNMAVLDGADIVYIERCRGSGARVIDLNIRVGSRLPAYCTSMGKVLLRGAPTLGLRALLATVQLT